MSDATAAKPPKRELFDVAAGVNIDPKGYRRPVDRYRETPAGLYLARGSDHRDFHYLESWLLPGPGLRVSRFHRRPGSSYDFDLYLDVADIAPPADPGGPWRSRDLYLDVVVAGGRVRLEDAGELTAAVAAGILGPAEAAAAIDRGWRAVAGIAAHGGDALAWLAGAGLELDFADPGQIRPVAEGAWADAERVPGWAAAEGPR